MSLYGQLVQRQQANESFNRGAGLLAASMYPGRRPDMIMNAMSGQTQDPGALMNSIMSIQNFQRQQQQYQQIQGAAPGLAKQLNVDLPTPRRSSPAANMATSKPTSSAARTSINGSIRLR